ncbi:MAG: efflux RND transporter periplasmic adaptor subunit, partial [Peptococcaceae bacterium]
MEKKKFFTKKKMVAGVAVLAVAAGGFLFFSGGKDGGIPVTVAAVEQKDLRESVSLKAPLEGTETVEIVSNLHYEITAIHVKEGDRVQKGQVLAVLDSEAMADEIGSAQDALAMAQAQYEDSVRSQQQQYEQAVQALQNAQNAADRTAALFEIGGVSAEEQEKAQSALAEAQAAIKGFSVKDGKVQGSASELKSIETARNALARKQEALSDGKIISPIDGTVTRVNINVGRFADETDDNKPMFVVENLQQLQMKVNVSEYDIADIQTGQKVEITADVLKGQTVSGVVDRVSPTGELKEGSSAERVIPTVVRLTESNEALIAGINAKAEIIIEEVQNVLAVPIEAVADNGDGTGTVMRVKEDSTVETLSVKLGLETDLEMEVISDELQVGDQLLLNRDGITDGMTVTI